MTTSRLGNPNTASESLFERYLIQNAYTDWTHEQPIEGKRTTPDYRLRHDGTDLFFDVKEFQTSPLPLGFSMFDPYRPIREKINQAARQFKQYKEYSCSLVLSNPQLAFVPLDSPDTMVGTMLGDVAFQVQIGGPPDEENPPPVQIFTERGKMVNRQRQEAQNTTISAVIVLSIYPLRQKRITLERSVREKALGRRLTSEEWEQVVDSCVVSEEHQPVRVAVYENPYARMPLSRELFSGPFDERYGSDGDDLCWIYVGEDLRRLEDELTGKC